MIKWDFTIGNHRYVLITDLLDYMIYKSVCFIPAFIISYSIHQSMGWALFSGFVGLPYLIYWFISYIF